jgi:type III secretion system chaperone SycN
MAGLADQTVADFGRSMGMDGLAFDENGLVCLDIERTGTLYLEYRQQEQQVLVYLARTMDSLQEQWLEQALARCHYQYNHPMDISCGLKGDNILFFLVTFTENAFIVNSLHRALDLLVQQHDAVVKGS